MQFLCSDRWSRLSSGGGRVRATPADHPGVPMTDVYSPIPELNLLKEFDNDCDEAYAQWAGMDDFGEMKFLREDPELMHGLIRFAQANGSGSLYALWRRDDRADLATLPVVLLGHEGGIHIVARDLREFFRLLGALEGEL